MQFNPKHRVCKCGDGLEMSIPIQVDPIVEEFLTRTRRILVVGLIDEMSSVNICNYLQLFSLTKDPIYMYINSPGGCLASGYAIIDQMLSCRGPVYTIVRGQAHSMGAIISIFGTKGKRYATPNSSMMLHSVIIQSGMESLDKHNSMIKYVNDDYLEKMKAMARRTKLTNKQLLSMMEETKWMSPKTATRMGIIDGLWTPTMERKIYMESR
jgi:ATP-dependent Clp protease protease subunit